METKMIIHMNLGSDSYDIVVERGVLAKAGEHLSLDRRVLIVTDTGVPKEYAETVASQCKAGIICTVEQGEASKSLEGFGKLLGAMLDNGISRKDCVVAIGGGVVGDLAGFAASAYMRGIDFYNIPTTLLSQIDSSIGGKTAINFGGVKNIVGAFYQPKKVLVDPELLKTLPKRQISNGLAEAIKVALTSDKELFDIFENGDIENNIDEIIIRSLNIKKDVVEQDEKETGLRKILNFGHTVGHGIESSEGMSELYHGECVALGMIPMCGETIRPRLIEVLKKCDLYRVLEYDWDKISSAAFHDKKADGALVSITTVSEVGSFEMKTVKCLDVIEMAKEGLEGLK
jgi:3-dehydroquinate synthase